MSKSKQTHRALGHSEPRPGARRSKKRIVVRQAELDFRSWGGARKGAGRKRKSERPRVPHVVRPEHQKSLPVLVTSRVLAGLPSLRSSAEARCILDALASSRRARAGRKGSARESGRESGHGTSGPRFQVVHHSIQSNHLHLIVEARDRKALTSGMRGLLIRVARALNRLWSRRGSVFADRFHERELCNPQQVRNALVYVLNNGRKHGLRLAGPDPLSSGPDFDGWRTDEDERIDEQRRTATIRGRATAAPRLPARTRLGGNAGRRGGQGLEWRALERAARTASPRAQTWLLGQGWKRHGLIDLLESPRGG